MIQALDTLDARLARNRAAPGWRHLVASALCATALMAGCGGGSDGVGTGGTGNTDSFSSGRIAGFGSVIVNGVRFDDSAARVSDDDDASHDRGDLKLGMTVDLSAGAVSTDASSGSSTAVARSIQFHSEIKGPVDTVDAAAGTLQVLGQTVTIDGATVFDGVAGGLAGIAPGALVEVYALFDATNRLFKATRIEAKVTLAEFRLRGLVANLDTTAHTFTLGGATVSYAGLAASTLPALADGALVKVKLQPVQQAGVWIATQLKAGGRAVPDAARSEVEGIVTELASLASFRVGGVPVNASGASFDDGNAAILANGARVEVHGAVVGGVLVATRVEFKRPDGDDVEIELHGAIDSADAAAKTFVLRGQTVRWSDATRIDDGSGASLVAGAQVEVRGSLATGGTQVIATRIKLAH